MATKGHAESAETAEASGLITDQVVNKAHEAIDRAAVHARDAEARAREKTASSVQQLESTHDHARQELDAVLRKLDGFVREKPFAAAGVAFAAGVLTAALLRR